MSDEQLEEGKKWVADKVQELAEKHHFQLKTPNWRQSSEDFDKDRHSLEIVSNTGEYRIIKFSDNDLRDCPADKTKTAEWEGQIEGAIKSLADSRGKE